MKPLSGKFLYINLGFAIVWDSLGFLLFFLGLTPLVVFTVVLSVVVDILAFLTDFTFCILYQGYVKIYNVNFRLYQIKRIKEMIQLSKISGVSKNPIANSLSRQTQKLNQYVTSKFSNYVWEFAVKKIQYSIITSVVELIPWLGDFSPSWTIKANLHLREHRKIARELKIRNVEFENSLAKWRGSLRFGGIGKYKSRNNNRADKKTSANNIRSFNRERLAGSRAQTVIKQQSINQGVRDSATNNIIPFTRQPRAGGQPTQGQNKQLSNIKSTAANSDYRSGQVFGNIPQFLEYEDDRFKDKKSSANKKKPIKTKVLDDISKPIQAQNNNQDNNNISVANNIKKFNRAQQDQANSEQILENLIKK